MADGYRAIVISAAASPAPSIAYHLTELGWSDVLLVDRCELTSGLDVPLGGTGRPAPLERLASRG